MEATLCPQAIVARNLIVPDQEVGCCICDSIVAGPAVQRDIALWLKCKYPLSITPLWSLPEKEPLSCRTTLATCFCACHRSYPNIRREISRNLVSGTLLLYTLTRNFLRKQFSLRTLFLISAAETPGKKGLSQKLLVKFEFLQKDLSLMFRSNTAPDWGFWVLNVGGRRKQALDAGEYQSYAMGRES